MGDVTGLLLAAGAGRRMGGPKALLRREDGTPWVVAARQSLLDGGLDDVVVVLGAAADEAHALLGDVRTVVAEDWERGMGASLEAGLRALATDSAQLALVHLVDLPDVGADVVHRILSYADGPGTLVRAVFAGAPGHPVLIGRDHWPAIAAGADGEGARAYLAAHDAVTVECGDLASGTDRDRPQDLDPRRDI
ncbi:molybdopterin-guanine dinucleotide biosynthesis protein MobA [Aeromicrobium sp. PE09-221]|uniref:nucleotidyltransferase family protein n=1 Tax=Aeromicrobium sp. PE09-221 TaxID=1898043 RepID=UPI000B3E89E2|nr:nucleotidyltransferase family protein [Aeromicrobium sp. PE09-221]OUZ11600.1 molybdopterin-guanine dinucleotide biosynthesis protein MobA [Aeromicrobium sp. PE09-221]